MPASYANRREQLDSIKWMNRKHLSRIGNDSELEARISSYELGYRLQTSAPETFELSKETESIRKLYGIDESATAQFGRTPTYQANQKGKIRRRGHSPAGYTVWMA